MKVTYDEEAKAMYIYILEGGYDLKTEELAPDVFIDKTPLQQIYGIEVLNVSLIKE